MANAAPTFEDAVAVSSPKQCVDAAGRRDENHFFSVGSKAYCLDKNLKGDVDATGGNSGSWTWDNTSKTLTLKNFNYTQPEGETHHGNGAVSLRYYDDAINIVVDGKNKIQTKQTKVDYLYAGLWVRPGNWVGSYSAPYRKVNLSFANGQSSLDVKSFFENGLRTEYADLTVTGPGEINATVEAKNIGQYSTAFVLNTDGLTLEKGVKINGSVTSATNNAHGMAAKAVVIKDNTELNLKATSTKQDGMSEGAHVIGRGIDYDFQVLDDAKVNLEANGNIVFGLKMNGMEANQYLGPNGKVKVAQNATLNLTGNAKTFFAGIIEGDDMQVPATELLDNATLSIKGEATAAQAIAFGIVSKIIKNTGKANLDISLTTNQPRGARLVIGTEGVEFSSAGQTNLQATDTSDSEQTKAVAIQSPSCVFNGPGTVSAKAGANNSVKCGTATMAVGYGLNSPVDGELGAVQPGQSAGVPGLTGTTSILDSTKKPVSTWVMSAVEPRYDKVETEPGVAVTSAQIIDPLYTDNSRFAGPTFSYSANPEVNGVPWEVKIDQNTGELTVTPGEAAKQGDTLSALVTANWYFKNPDGSASDRVALSLSAEAIVENTKTKPQPQPQPQQPTNPVEPAKPAPVKPGKLPKTGV